MLLSDATPLEVFQFKIGIRHFLEKRGMEKTAVVPSYLKRQRRLAVWDEMAAQQGVDATGMTDEQKLFDLSHQRHMERLGDAQRTGVGEFFNTLNAAKALKAKNKIFVDSSVVPVSKIGNKYLATKSGIGRVIEHENLRSTLSAHINADDAQEAELIALRNAIEAMPPGGHGGRIALSDNQSATNNKDIMWLAHQNRMGVGWIPRKQNRKADSLAGTASRTAPTHLIKPK